MTVEPLPRVLPAAIGVSPRRLRRALGSLRRIHGERPSLERIEAEALRRSDVLKTALLRAVSHDLRTPLMAISTSAGALVSEQISLDECARAELLATILAASERLDRLVDNLLDVARLEAGAVEPQRGVWGVDELVRLALDEMDGDSSRIDVTTPLESPAVVVDAHHVQRVLANLIGNALKYSPCAAPVRVRVTATATEALVHVIDRGPGVAASEQERIFEAFERGSPGGETPGAGLGLAIARGFAEANGGRLWVDSGLGVGASFVLALPIAARARDENAGLASRRAGGLLSGS